MEYIKNINFIYLIIGLILGLIFGYLTKKKHIVYRYNKIEGKLVYEDVDENNEKCYKYVAEEIKCPNSDDVIGHPTTYG